MTSRSLNATCVPLAPFPLLVRTFNVDFVELATKVIVGAPFKASRIELMDVDHACVKVPMFSFTRLQGADPVLRVEMASTGEVGLLR